MTITASQSGFTDVYGTSVASLFDGATETGWLFDLYADNTGKTITIDMGGWFEGSSLATFNLYTPSQSLVPAGSFAMQLSADGVNWFNMPDATSSLNLGYDNLTTATFTPWPDSTNFRYIRFIGVGGAHALPPYLASRESYRSYLTFYTNMGFGGVGGSLITIDTSGGANPNPPSGTPDVDGGSGNDPGPVIDSFVPARTTSVSLEIFRADPGAVRVAGESLNVAHNSAGAVRVSGMTLAVLSRVVPQFNLEVSFQDEALLTAKMAGSVYLECSMSDEAVFNANLDLERTPQPQILFIVT